MIMGSNKKKYKIEVTEAQASAVEYAIQWYIDAVEGSEGVGHEVRSCKAFLKKIT